MFAKITLFPTFGCIFCQNHAYSQFLLHVRRNHAYSLHTHLHHHTTRSGGINHVYSHLFHVRRNHAFPTFSCMFAKFTLIPTFCCAKNCEICIFFAKLLHCSHFCCMFAKITLIPTFCCMFAEITCIPSTPKASRSSYKSPAIRTTKSTST